MGDIDLTFGCPMKRLLFFLTAMLFASSSFLIAHEEEMQIESEELMILANENDSSILDYSDGIFYLNPKNLLFSMEGIFLQTDLGYRVPLKSISFDALRGYYQEPRIFRNCKYSWCPGIVFRGKKKCTENHKQ